MKTVLNFLKNSAITTLNVTAKVLKPVIYYAQKEKDVFIKANLAKDASKTVGQLAKEQGKEASSYSASLGAILATINGVWMSAFYIWNNNRSKKIPEERKKTLNINIIITTLFALGLGVLLNPVMRHFTKGLQAKVSGAKIMENLSPKNIGKVIDKIKTDNNLIDKAVSAMPELKGKPTGEIAQKYAPKYVEKLTKDGIKSIVDLLYITAAFRFAGPIIATPLAEKTNQLKARLQGTKAPDKTSQSNQLLVVSKMSHKEFFKLPDKNQVNSYLNIKG